ncbi:MAG: tetratricopeptide repeat protein [Geminicoccaceae bacterium]|nr:MAG: tetratricopeptide repeat protein [Geminicoccaceae bacterium]
MRPRWALVGAVVGAFVLAGCAPGAQATDQVVLPSYVSPSGAFLTGQFALARGQLGAAAAGLARALQTTPDDLDLKRQVFSLTVASGDVEASRALALDLVEGLERLGLAGAAAEAWLWLAADAVREGDLTAAADRLALVEERSLPGLVRPLVAAWLEPDPAVGAAGLATGDTGLGDLIASHRVALLERSGRIEEALGVLAALGLEPSELPERLLAEQARLLMLLDEPEAGLAVLQLGRGGPTRSDRLAMVEAALRAGTVPPPAVPSAEHGMADALLAIAELLTAQRRPLQATFYTQTALHVAPDHDAGWLLLAGLLAEQEGPEMGALALANVPAGSIWYASAQVERAEFLSRQGEIDEAVAVLEGQIDARPHDPRPAMALGDLLRRQQRFEEATEAYAKALARIGPTGTEHWRLYYARGIAYERSRRWPEAERDLKRALELNPDQPYVLNYLGYSWVDQGLHLVEARAMLYRAVELMPEDGYIVDSLGWAYFRLGDYVRAVELLERAVELAPGDPVINDHLGDAFWRVGRYREARFQWERALRLDPEPEEIEAIEAKLRRGLPAPDDDAG